MTAGRHPLANELEGDKKGRKRGYSTNKSSDDTTQQRKRLKNEKNSLS